MFFHKKILIVDEAESSRRFLRHVLTNAGYTVETASNNYQALERVCDSHFNIFFIDISLPNLEGMKLIKRLRELEGYETTPILVMTFAMAITDDMIQECGAANISEWIAKPISPTKVTSLLKRMDYENTNTYYSQSNG